MNIKTQNLEDLDVYASKIEPQLRLQSLVWFGLWVVELLLITRFMLKLFMPHLDSVLRTVTYTITDYLLIPLTVFFGAPPASGPTFEWITLFTILLYLLLVTGIMSLFKTNTRMSRVEIARAYSKRKYMH
jgi:hypothetical protein